MKAYYQEKYEMVIGLEIHAQLKTQSKIFAHEGNIFGSEPNTQISVISLAHPGTLPRLNTQVVEYAIKMGLACNCEIASYSVFDRKNYFYPDLPKGYQISQDKYPICIGGSVFIEGAKQGGRNIKLHHIHLEEDAGKSIHVENADYTQLDYNRAGTPLIEIVTEPDMHHAEEATQLFQEIRRLAQYLEICDGNMEEGSLRCDANVSVRLYGAAKLGTRVEVKNMNSVRNLKRAIEYEFERQCALIEAGESFIQETRSFEPETGKTFALRSKESLNDYRYFPDPDLPPILVTENWKAEIKSKMPMLPLAWREKLMTQYELSAYNAQLLTEEKETVLFFEAISEHTLQYKDIANWLNGEVKAWLNESNKSLSEFPITAQRLAELIELIAQNKISRSLASTQVFPLLLQDNKRSASQIIAEQGLEQEDDSSTLKSIIKEVLEEMPDKVKAFKTGKKGMQGLFMGQIMKKTAGKADPKLTAKLLQEALEEVRY
jgi:aspartyl-tRNA(Asn)/glutamyl-tRNA(Gln) amidotransferase subunit B